VERKACQHQPAFRSRLRKPDVRESQIDGSGRHPHRAILRFDQNSPELGNPRIDSVHPSSALKSGRFSAHFVQTPSHFAFPLGAGVNAKPATRHENPTQATPLGNESSVMSVSPRLRSIINKKPTSATIEPAHGIASRPWQGDGDQHSWGHQLRPCLPGKFR
jgi:hypothetical protein